MSHALPDSLPDALPGLPSRPTRRGLLAAGLIALVAIPSRAADPGPAAAAPAAVTIRIDNFTFTPAELTIARGTTVTWENADDIPHTVVNPKGAFRSKPLDTGDHFGFTFTAAGEFTYFCSLHPHMTGKIRVTD